MEVCPGDSIVNIQQLERYEFEIGLPAAHALVVVYVEDLDADDRAIVELVATASWPIDKAAEYIATNGAEFKLEALEIRAQAHRLGIRTKQLRALRRVSVDRSFELMARITAAATQLVDEAAGSEVPRERFIAILREQGLVINADAHPVMAEDASEP